MALTLPGGPRDDGGRPAVDGRASGREAVRVDLDRPTMAPRGQAQGAQDRGRQAWLPGARERSGGVRPGRATDGVSASGLPTALIYTRVSTDDQAREGLSLEA